jgi:hypothetical protein
MFDYLKNTSKQYKKDLVLSSFLNITEYSEARFQYFWLWTFKFFVVEIGYKRKRTNLFR